MTLMVVYDCQSCGGHSARRIGEMPWQCDHCKAVINVGTDRDIAIVTVPEKVTSSKISANVSYSYSKEIFSERGIEAYEAV